MDIQRLRNITTGILHTKIEHVYADIEQITGCSGVMTHQLPNACRALGPYLREELQDTRLWDRMYDPNHIGEIEVPTMNEAEQKAMWDRYEAMPSLLTLSPSSVESKEE